MSDSPVPMLESDEPGFFSIKIDTLRADLVTGFDLYLPAPPGREPVLYRASDLAFTEPTRIRLEEHRISELLVKKAQRRAWLKYTEKVLPTFLADTAVPVRERASLLYDSAQNLVHEILDNPDTGEMIQQSRDTVDTMVGFLFAERTSFYELMELTSFDYYTYTPSVNVFVYCVTLANRIGLAGPEVREFAHGALMHDIGKRKIDAEIINSKGKLTEAQWDQMRLHPVYGHSLLLEQGEKSEIALDVTRHHHEKINGRGYPDGLVGNEISVWARISTIADIFDALTTKRSYKDAMDTFLALQFMREKMWDELDHELYKEFIAMMGRPG